MNHKSVTQTFLLLPPAHSLLGFFFAQKLVQNDKKYPGNVILNDSEESCVQIGRIPNSRIPN